jgi:hypothetical protein
MSQCQCADEISALRDEVERLKADRDAWQLEAQGCVCGSRRVAECRCMDTDFDGGK